MKPLFLLNFSLIDLILRAFSACYCPNKLRPVDIPLQDREDQSVATLRGVYAPQGVYTPQHTPQDVCTPQHILLGVCTPQGLCTFKGVSTPQGVCLYTSRCRYTSRCMYTRLYTPLGVCTPAFIHL